LQCIKKEFVGIFEMCGYAILPGRLGRQIPEIAKLLANVNHDEQYALTEEYAIFNGWLNQSVRPHVKNGVDVSKALELGLQEAFLDILRDNSPFAAEENEMFQQWFQLASIVYLLK